MSRFLRRRPRNLIMPRSPHATVFFREYLARITLRFELRQQRPNAPYHAPPRASYMRGMLMGGRVHTVVMLASERQREPAEPSCCLFQAA
jgi:hypothetical protein